ncbi:alpha/beta hydrolase [Micromonospora sp. NPDC049679]|uniref:alpha/beta hydrolase family protein n=1 Tax=Micromonospora sp. NPDC049679 TaxID=3155920 RepID=UPI0033D0245F
MKRLVTGVIALLMPVALTACGQAIAAPVPAPRAAAAPQQAYAVGVRTLTFGRGTARPLPTIAWYPAASGSAGDAPRRNVPLADGRFPIVLYSHGLHSMPAHHAALTTRWAAAGFVVVAPAYPYTNLRTARFDRGDVRNQPADAWHVINQVRVLNDVPGDLFAGRLDTARVAAAGHSAGGYTTAGMFTRGHSARLRGGIVIAGGMRDTFGGPPAAMLFVHGGADPTVKLATARSAYDRTPWPKGFLTLPGQRHGEYMGPGQPGFDQIMATMTDFLRWTLYGDATARGRLPADAQRPGVTRWEGRI